MRYAERRRLQEERERKIKLELRADRRRWKRRAGRRAYCYDCKKESTYEKLFVNGYPTHPRSKGNLCEECCDKALADDGSPGFSEYYAGEDIFWRLGR